MARKIVAFASLAACIAAPVATASTVSANVDVSETASSVAAAVPMIALDPMHPHRVLVAWRTFSVPLRGNVPAAGGSGVCHLSISEDDGARFRDLEPPLTSASEFCNAPWVAVAGNAIVTGATITARPVPPGTPRSGATLVGLVRSVDGGRTWQPRIAAITSEDLSRFVLRDGVDASRVRSAHDGARGVYDPARRTLYVTGAHPEPPGSAASSQRYVTASRDGGRSFGAIRGFDSLDWPGRWDGDIAFGRGALALSYVGGAPGEPDCPCAILGITRDNGATISRSVAARGSEFSLADLVHVPVVAADRMTTGRFAIGLIGADNASVRIYLTADDGAHWRMMIAPQPPGVVKVTRVGVAIAPDHTLVATWRGAQADGAYDLYAAASHDGDFAPPVRISSATSTRPPTIPATGFEGGDFTSWVSADTDAAHFAWADARDGQSVRVFYARVPLTRLHAGGL